MYENSCSYQNALDLKRLTATPPQVKTEDCLGLGQCSADWASYRFHQSTFEQLKQSVEKAKAALQDRSNYLGSSAFRYFSLHIFFLYIIYMFLYPTVTSTPPLE